jgi:holo-[acyl-carrier protein] synthase
VSVIGVGIDLIDIARVQALFTRHGARAERRLLTDAEAAYVSGCAEPARHAAARIAAKEAVYKALQSLPGARAIGWTDIEVVRDPDGRPTVVLHGRAAEVVAPTPGLRLHLSLTHAEQTAGAVAIAEAPGT